MAQAYGVYGQIIGREIIQGTNIIDLIELNHRQYVSNVSIRTDPEREIDINGHIFYMNDKGILEFQDAKITSLKFPINAAWPIDDYTVITFSIQEEVY